MCLGPSDEPETVFRASSAPEKPLASHGNTFSEGIDSCLKERARQTASSHLFFVPA